MRAPWKLRVDVASKSCQFLETLVEHTRCVFFFLFCEQRCSSYLELDLLSRTLVSEVINHQKSVFLLLNSLFVSLCLMF